MRTENALMGTGKELTGLGHNCPAWVTWYLRGIRRVGSGLRPIVRSLRYRRGHQSETNDPTRNEQ